MSVGEKKYIGDGVYVSHDGWQMLLETQRGSTMEQIFLESEVLVEFLNYVAKSGLYKLDVLKEIFTERES